MVGKKRALAPAPLDVEPIRVPASLEREPLVVPTTPRSRLNTALCPGTHQARRTVFLFLVHVLPMSSKLIRATMLASVDTIIESVGGPTPEVISVDTDAHQILATKVNSRAFLVVIAPKKVSRAVVRKTMRGLNARLAVAGSKSTHLHVEQTEKQRVNVR